MLIQLHTQTKHKQPQRFSGPMMATWSNATIQGGFVSDLYSFWNTKQTLEVDFTVKQIWILLGATKIIYKKPWINKAAGEQMLNIITVTTSCILAQLYWPISIQDAGRCQFHNKMWLSIKHNSLTGNAFLDKEALWSVTDAIPVVRLSIWSVWAWQPYTCERADGLIDQPQIKHTFHVILLSKPPRDTNTL